MSEYDGTNVNSTSTPYCVFDTRHNFSGACQDAGEQQQDQEQEQKQDQQHSGGAGELGSSVSEDLSCDEKLIDETIYSEDGLAKYTCKNYRTDDGVSWISINGFNIPVAILYEHLYDMEEKEGEGEEEEQEDQTEHLMNARNYELVFLSLVTSGITGFLMIVISIYLYYIMRGACEISKSNQMV